MQIHGVNHAPYWTQHFPCVPTALREPSTKLVSGPVQWISNHGVYIKHRWLWKVTLPLLFLTYTHPSSLPSLSSWVPGEFYGHSIFPRGCSCCNSPFPTPLLKDFFFLCSILPSDTSLRFCFLNTVYEVPKLPANEVKLPGQEIEFFSF